MTLSNDELLKIEERVKAATPGEWKFNDQFGWLESDTQTILSASHDGNFISNVDIKKNNAEFIAHAREDVPKLISALRQSQKRVERLEWTLKKFQADGYEHYTVQRMSRYALSEKGSE